MKTSKITTVNKVDMFNGLYVFEITTDSGDEGRIYKKQDDPKVKEGDEITYSITDKGTMKIQNEFEQQGGFTKAAVNPKREKLIVRTSALKCSIEFDKGDVNEVIERAEMFVDFIMDKKNDNVPF